MEPPLTVKEASDQETQDQEAMLEDVYGMNDVATKDGRSSRGKED